MTPCVPGMFIDNRKVPDTVMCTNILVHATTNQPAVTYPNITGLSHKVQNNTKIIEGGGMTV